MSSKKKMITKYITLLTLSEYQLLLFGNLRAIITMKKRYCNTIFLDVKWNKIKIFIKHTFLLVDMNV
jgi:hypothetical protein